MNHQGCFLTGVLAGQRLKRWRLGLSSGAPSASFYDWAAGAGAPEELRSPEAYARFIAGLPPNIQLNSDNTLSWSPTIDDAAADYPLQVYTGGMRIATGGTAYYYTSQLNALNNFTISGSYTLNSDRRSWTVVSRSANGIRALGISCFRYVAPVDGTYCLNRGISVIGSANYANGTVAPTEIRFPDERGSGGGSVAFAGGTYPLPRSAGNTCQYSEVTEIPSFAFYGSGSCVLCDFTMYLPVFIIRPYSTLSCFSVARPGTLPGSPVNESARTFVNPLTGERISFDSFTYDYFTRTYTLTLPDNGGTMTVTFGEDNMTITDINGETAQALYPESDGVPVAAPDSAFDKTAFLSGLAAGLTSRGWS